MSLARYRVKPERVNEFLEVIDRHWVTLRERELVTDREVEISEWVDGDAATRIDTHPLVSGVWESMGPLCERERVAARSSSSISNATSGE